MPEGAGGLPWGGPLVRSRSSCSFGGKAAGAWFSKSTAPGVSVCRWLVDGFSAGDCWAVAGPLACHVDQNTATATIAQPAKAAIRIAAFFGRRIVATDMPECIADETCRVMHRATLVLAGAGRNTQHPGQPGHRFGTRLRVPLAASPDGGREMRRCIGGQLADVGDIRGLVSAELCQTAAARHGRAPGEQVPPEASGGIDVARDRWRSSGVHPFRRQVVVVLGARSAKP